MDHAARTHLVGLLLGTENDWPVALEALVRALGPVTDAHGVSHTMDTERVTIEPFSLRDRPRHALVIDRLAYWYYVPREWLKKVALMDGVYLLNNPFTFQAMEKHSAYCAMMRLGLKIPDTVLVPYKHPVDNARYAYTAERYNLPFDLEAVAAPLGYPLYMKPFDGGGWRGVSRVDGPDDLRRADLFPRVLGMSGNYDPTSWNGWGERGDALYFNAPFMYLEHMQGDHLDWLRRSVFVQLCVGRGAWEENPTRALPSTLSLGALLRARGIPHAVDVWGEDTPHDWPSWARMAAKHLSGLGS